MGRKKKRKTWKSCVPENLLEKKEKIGNALTKQKQFVKGGEGVVFARFCETGGGAQGDEQN